MKNKGAFYETCHQAMTFMSFHIRASIYSSLMHSLSCIEVALSFNPFPNHKF